MDYRHFDFDEIIVVLEIHLEFVVHFEFFALWLLSQDFELTKWNQMGLEVYVRDLHILNQVMIGYHLVIIEHHQNAHLIGADAHFVLLGSSISDFRSDFSVSLI